MLDPKKLEDIARQIADSVPPGVKNMAEEAEGRIKHGPACRTGAPDGQFCW